LGRITLRRLLGSLAGGSIIQKEYAEPVSQKILRLAAAKIAFSGDEQSRPALLFDGGENLLLIFDDGIEGALILQNGALILFYGFLIALNLLLIGKNLFLIRDDLLLIRNDVPLGHYFQASRP
jgi:hypothetical protein